MYHSLTFGDGSIYPYGPHEKKGLAMGVNTWDDWHLIPAAKPEISPPEVYKNYIDLPGAHGKIDLSEYLTGGPVYKNRTGSLEFYLAPGYGFWGERHNQICNFLHGRKLYMTLEDEPQYSYHGRFSVDSPKSDPGSGHETISISYELDPFKFILPRSSFDEIWDRFLFEDLHEYEYMSHIDASASPVFSIPGYTNGFMLRPFLDGPTGNYPIYVDVFLNSTGVTLRQLTASDPVQTSGQLEPVSGSWNTVKITGNGYVTLHVYGGTL